MTPQEYLDYYSNLLLMQYKGKPKAKGTIQALVNMLVMPQTSIQEIVFSRIAASGSFYFSYKGFKTGAIAWNASTSFIQSRLRLLPELSAVTVEGSVTSQTIRVTFTGVKPPALLLQVAQNSLYNSGGLPVVADIAAVDQTLLEAVQYGYELETAVGVQLDVIGKICGVSRNGYTFSGAVTLDDEDFRTVIKMAILQNNSGSSLKDIQDLISIYFPGVLRVFDYASMRLSYLLDSVIGSNTLVEFFIKQGSLPKPMGVRLSVIVYSPTINNFFGCRTYQYPAYNVSGVNFYDNYNMNSPVITYADGIYK